MILKERLGVPPNLKGENKRSNSKKGQGGFISYCCTNKMFFGGVGRGGGLWGGAVVKAIHIHLLE